MPSRADEKWSSLVQQYGSEQAIPLDVHYAFIDDPELRAELWKKYEDLGLEKYLQAMATHHYFVFTRKRTRGHLYWMAKYFTWETNPESAGRTFEDNKFCEYVHGRLCDVFVKKDNTKGIPAQDTTSKQRLVLYPRGAGKSTIDQIDAAQWVMNFPEIRLLFLTAADDLAVSFVDATKGHFVFRPHQPTLMNIYFPEFCADEKDLTGEAASQFTCPVWKRQQIRRVEPTLMAASITSNLSGYHFEVIKADDVVSNRNSENEDQCKKVTKKINVSVRKMLRPFGYFDVIGTRYSDEDYYGELIEKNVGESKREHGPCWETIDNLSSGLKILIGRAWELTADAKEQLDKGLLRQEELKAEHYNLLYPDVLSYSFLRQEQVTDEITFEGQYNQNPRPVSTTPFTRPMLQRATVSFQEMPFRGPTSQTWDFAFSAKKGRDYSTASCALWNEKGQCYIQDLIRGRFHHLELAKAVVEFAMKWRPFVIGIEDIAGSRFLEPVIINEAQRTGNPEVIAVCSKIDWIKPEQQKDAKRMRMAALQPWIASNRMKFASYLPYLEVLYGEFERCLTSHHHDDIPDVISRQVKYAPSMLQVIEKQQFQTVNRADVAWHMLYEEGYVAPSYGWLLSNNPETGQLEWNAPPLPSPMVNPEPIDTGPTTLSAPGLDPILGAGVCG